MRYRIVSLLLLLLVSWWITPTPTWANEKFHTDLQTTYTVSPTGTTTVNQVLTLTNRTPTDYITRYGLKITSPDISNVSVRSNGQALTPEIVKTDAQTSIGITFPDVIAGEGQKRVVEISYRDPDAAIISGKVLEVLVPRLAAAEEYDSYALTIITPEQFGTPTRITPATYTVDRTGSNYTTRLYLNRGESVTALYGTQQVFNFDLKYHLLNPSPNTGLAQIALPPDTTYQKVNYEVLDPRPDKIEVDSDGNWIATYQVPSEATIIVQAQGQAYLSLNPIHRFAGPSDLQPWLRGQEFWDISNPQITELAQDYQTPRAIYDYIVETFDYNYASLEGDNPRLGAINALNAPNQTACQEFTDAFVAISRAAGIPARRVTGYAYTQNNLLRPLDLNRNILHAWPEYYDRAKQQWIPIDPTWGNTTGGVNYFDQFDLNHIVFAINGVSSTLPFPVGSYAPDQVTADESLRISFGQFFPELAPELDIRVTTGGLAGLPIPGHNQLLITNQTGQAWYNIRLTPQVIPADYTLPSSLEVPELLPYQTVMINVPVFHQDWLMGEKIPLQLTADYENLAQERHTISLSPVSLSAGGQAFYYLGHPVFAVALGGSCVLGFILAGGVLVHRSRRPRPVRRKS